MLEMSRSQKAPGYLDGLLRVRQLPVQHVQIRAADGAGLHAQEELFRSQLGEG